MKKLTIAIIVLVGLMTPMRTLLSNPILITYFNEILLAGENGAGWSVELKITYLEIETLDGGFITSSTDTAYLDSGISLSWGDIILIQGDNLQSTLTFNPQGDIITLFAGGGYWLDEFRYGNVEYSRAPSPIPGQSLCLDSEDNHWYMDNSPTLGLENDFEGARGTIEGIVFNSDGNPLVGARVRYGWHQLGNIRDTIYVETDNLGYYEFQEVSKALRFTAYNSGYTDVDTLYQIFPDSIQQVDFYLRPVVGIHEFQANQHPSQIKLWQNYPNPFNGSTRISFSLPVSGMAHVRVFDLAGREVWNESFDNLTRGEHSLVWSARDSADRTLRSGVYLVEVSSGMMRASQKIVLVK